MDPSDDARAIAAATSIAASLGLAADDVDVLHSSNKLALRLLPCDVMARIAPVAHEHASFEVGIAQRLAGAGSPVAALDGSATSSASPAHHRPRGGTTTSTTAPPLLTLDAASGRPEP